MNPPAGAIATLYALALLSQSACVPVTSIPFPPDTSAGLALLAIESPSGAWSAIAVSPGSSLLGPSLEASSIHLLRFERSADELGILLIDGKVELAPLDAAPPLARPLPPSWRAYGLEETTWALEPSNGPISRLRLVADPCPTLGQEVRLELETEGPVRALLPFGPDQELVLTGTEHVPNVELNVYVAGSTLTRRRDIEAEIVRTSSAISSPAGFMAGDDRWVVSDDGTLLQIDLEGRVSPLHARFPRSSHVLAAAGAYDDQHRLEAFALTRFVREGQGSFADGELYYLAPGASEWEATGFQGGAPRIECSGAFAFASMVLAGPGVVRFTYQSAVVHEYQAGPRRFLKERVGDSSEQYCDASIHRSDRLGEWVVVSTEGPPARSSLFHRTAQGWSRLLEDDSLTRRGFVEMGGEIYVVARGGHLAPIRAFAQQDLPPLVGSCPAQLAGGEDIAIIDAAGSTVYFDQTRSDRTRYLGRASIVDPASTMVPDGKGGKPAGL